MKIKIICDACLEELEANVLPIDAVGCDMILEVDTNCECSKGAAPINEKVKEILRETIKSLEEIE